MDHFTQAIAYLKPSFEVLAKVGSIIPVWMLFVMADKHLMGMPLLEGSMWQSPRIPRRITMKPNNREAKPSRFETDRHSATANLDSSHGGEEARVSESVRTSEPLSSSLFEPGFSDAIMQTRQPTWESLVVSNSPSLGASTTTALANCTPLEIHDHLFARTAWYESGHFGIAIMLVVAMLLLGILNICRSLSKSQASQASAHRNTKDVGTQFPDPPDRQHLVLEIPAYWEFIPSAGESLDSETTLQDNSKKSKTATRCSHCEELLTKMQEESSVKDKKKDDTKSDVPIIGEKEEESGRGSDQLTGEVEEKEGKEERKEGIIQDGKTEDAGTDMIVVGRKEEDRGQHRDQLRSETGDREGRTEWEEDRKVDREDEWKETAKTSGDDGLDGSQVVEGQPKKNKKKKKKKRGVRANAKQRAAKKAEAAESNNTTGEASNDLLQDQKQRGHEEGKPKLFGSEVAEPGASDALAMSQTKGKDKAPVEGPETAGKEGSYSLKQNDLLEATFVASKPSLPPRPPTPQSKEISTPLGLPPRPHFSKLPISKNNGTPQSAPVGTAKPGLSSSLWASTGKGPAQPKRDVPPLLPHHQSFGVAQKKAVFDSLSAQGAPIAGTNPGSSSHFGVNNGVKVSSFFGATSSNGSMYRFGGDRGGAGR